LRELTLGGVFARSLLCSPLQPSYSEDELVEVKSKLKGRTFGSYEHRWLVASNSKKQTPRPAKRALDFQAKRAHIRALREGWIDEAKFDQYRSFASEYGGRERVQWVLKYFEDKAKEEREAAKAIGF
jgi:hypothetical protein